MAARRKNNPEDLAKLQQLFEDDFGKPQDHTQKSWVRGDVIQRGNVEKIDQDRGGLYRPGQQVLTTRQKKTQEKNYGQKIE